MTSSGLSVLRIMTQWLHFPGDWALSTADHDSVAPFPPATGLSVLRIMTQWLHFPGDCPGGQLNKTASQQFLLKGFQVVQLTLAGSLFSHY